MLYGTPELSMWLTPLPSHFRKIREEQKMLASALMLIAHQSMHFDGTFSDLRYPTMLYNKLSTFDVCSPF